jgi:RHS repeat-associated protein
MGGLMDYNARFYSPYLNRFISPDNIVPDGQNPQAWNRYSYVGNQPINLNDPTGHFANLAIGAAIGGIVGAALYIYSESKQSDGFNFKDDWADLAVAAGTAAVAGGLIGSGVGAVAGVEMLGGIGMAGALVVDHATNIATGSDFSIPNHIDAGGVGFMTGATIGMLPEGTPTLVKMLVASTVNGGYSFLKRRLGMIEDDDPIGDMIDMITAGASEGIGSGISNGMKPIIGESASELAGGLGSAAVETTVKVKNKKRISQVRTSNLTSELSFCNGRTCRR